MRYSMGKAESMLDLMFLKDTMEVFILHLKQVPILTIHSENLYGTIMGSRRKIRKWHLLPSGWKYWKIPRTGSMSVRVWKIFPASSSVSLWMWSRSLQVAAGGKNWMGLNGDFFFAPIPDSPTSATGRKWMDKIWPGSLKNIHSLPNDAAGENFAGMIGQAFWLLCRNMQKNVMLLSRPELADFCDWERLDGNDCAELLRNSSNLSPENYKKLKKRSDQIRVRIGWLDGFWTSLKESQCGSCRFLSKSLFDYVCFYYPPHPCASRVPVTHGIPVEYWNNQKQCPRRKPTGLAASHHLYDFALKWLPRIRQLFSLRLRYGFGTEMRIWHFWHLRSLHIKKNGRTTRGPIPNGWVPRFPVSLI